MIMKRMIVLLVFLIFNSESILNAQIFQENSEYVVVQNRITVWKYENPTKMSDQSLRYGDRFSVVRVEDKDANKVVILKINGRRGQDSDELFWHKYNNLMRSAVNVEHSHMNIDQYKESVGGNVLPYMAKFKVEKETRVKNILNEYIILYPDDVVYYRGIHENEGRLPYYFTLQYPKREIKQTIISPFNWNRQNFRISQDTLEKSFTRISNGIMYDDRMRSFIKGTRYLSTSLFSILKTSNGKIDRSKFWDNTYYLAGPWVVIPTGVITERNEYEVVLAPNQIENLTDKGILNDGEKLYISMGKIQVFVVQ